jgi:apolipoprotein N-acyltransferase
MSRLVDRKSGCGLLGGLLWAAAFPNIGIAGLAWVAPGLILACALGASPGRAFRLGYMAGLVNFGVSLYWLLYMPFPFGALTGWLALSAYLALYPAVWVWLCIRLLPSVQDSPGVFPGERAVFQGYMRVSGLRRGLWALACATIWVALEMVVGRVLTGFPWNFLGASQYRILPVIQIASVAGVYGVSFLVVWLSVSLMSSALAILVRPQQPRSWMVDLVVPMLLLAAACGFGVSRVVNAPEPDRFLDVALIQPSIPQTLIWDPGENSNRFAGLLELSEQAMGSHPDLMVWPEAAVPNLLRYEPESLQAVQRLATGHGVWMVLGADDAVSRHSDGPKPEFDFFNSAFLMDPKGELASVYRKRKLVIFGEYIPLVRWLPFLRYFTPIGDGFAAGSEPVPFQMPDLGATLSVVICFEDVFPHLVRGHATSEVDFLLNITNNGWFGESAAQWQHAANAVFRAVENGLPLVRCANNGLTCLVDSRGRLSNTEFPGTDNVYGRGFKKVRVPLGPRGGQRESTFYNRHGDWFAWGCVGITVLVGGTTFRRRSRNP